MKQLQILPAFTFAGHCTVGGSNKDWVACLAREGDDQQTTPSEINDMTEVVYLCLYGPHGGNLRVEPPQRLTMSKAKGLYQKKCAEKAGKGYASVPFAPYVPAFGSPDGLPLVAHECPSHNEAEGSSDATSVLPAATGSTSRYQASVVKALTYEQVQQAMGNPQYSLTEKVNGERCVLSFDGKTLTAYNRKGKRMSAPPASALHLQTLACPFVLDGERLVGEQAGCFVAFDLLEWKNVDMTNSPYSLRIATLEEAMVHAGLRIETRPTPTHELAQANSTVPDLTLLVAAPGVLSAQQTLEEIQARAGEGIIIRDLTSTYSGGIYKFKFLADLDAFVLSINDGLASGSLKMGVVRATDQAIIEVANVRSGLSSDDVSEVRKMLEQGKRPVFTVTYLPKRTVGILLVEPRTSMRCLRDDKDALECTTEQFGDEKAHLIAQAKAIVGIVL